MAAEFVTSAAAKTVGNLTTEYASPYVNYFFHFGKNVEEFKNQRKELELKNDRVKNDVKEAERQTEVIEKDVLNWLERAEKELEETQSLEVEIERKKCFNWCPNWGWRYCLSKKVAEKTLFINKLLESSNFQRVGYRAPLQGIEFCPSKDFMPSESSNSAFNEIIKALNTDSVNMIGLYGMPGVGKTTLAKKIENHAKEQKLFDNVVSVTMSQTPKINTIQDRIAELLGLKFAASTEEGKAEELCRRLKGVKNLIITDDVWNEFNLQTIGIPFGVEHNGCKILLTTRLQQVCDQMNCQKRFQLNILSEDEAWALFKDNAGLENVPSRLNDVAKEVARECKGLPLAIETVGKALKSASLERWEAVNLRFKNSRHVENEDVCEGINNCLKLSYDCLNEDIRSCFLLCSLFPEDFDIPVELLIMLGIGYGLFSKTYLIEDLRRDIRVSLWKLQDSGLLLKNGDNYVSMHDVVRDFAHWITSKGENIFMFKEGLIEWPISDSCGCYTAISFWDSNIKTFPDKLKFLKLKILVFAGNNMVRVPIALVEGMDALQVLYLRKVVFSLEVLKFITNLRTLCFEDCELENISSLKNVKNLEILVLSDTNIYELSEEILALRRLKSLHFSSSRCCNFPPNLLSRLTSLQELHVTSENNVNLWELNSLSGLTALSLRVSTDQCVWENFVFHKLQRYNIDVNGNFLFLKAPTFRNLKISDFSTSLSAFKELFCNVEKLVLERVMEHKNIVPNVDEEGLKELTSLQLRFCKDLECLIDTEGEQGATAAFSNLVELNMEGLTCFKELCHGPPPIRFLQMLKDVIIGDCEWLEVVFEMDGILENEEIIQPPLLSNLTSLDLRLLPELESIWKLQPTHRYHAGLQSLKVVKISQCNKLKSIFSTCVVQNLLHLEELTVDECDELEQVFDFPQEVAELEPTHRYHASLQSLKVVSIVHCNKLKSIFSISFVQSLFHLEELTVNNCDELEQVFDFPQEVAELEPTHRYHASLQSLKVVRITKCDKLKSIFSTCVVQSLLHLEELIVAKCHELEEVFDFPQEVAELEETQVPLLSNLTCLELEDLPKLSCIWKGPTHLFNLRSLKIMRIIRCLQLAYLFPTPFAQDLVHLEVLEIQNCDSLEHLIKEAGSDYSLCWSKLRTLQIMSCKSLKYVFPITLAQDLVHLEVLKIQHCDSLEHLIKEAESDYSLCWSKLRNLQIMSCKSLKYVFPITLAQGLVHLEVLKIWHCDSLEHLIKEAESDYSLCWSKLRTLLIMSCKSLKYVFPITLAQDLVHLEVLKIQYCDSLEHLIKEAESDYSLCWSKLRTLQIMSCETLKYVFPITLAQGLVHLEVLQIRHCDSLEHLIKEAESDYSLCWSKLRTLQIMSCKSLKYVFPITLAQDLVHLEVLKIQYCDSLEHLIKEAESNYFLCWSKLRNLQIMSCKSLKYVFPITLAQGLVHLEVLKIRHCDSLEHLIKEAESDYSLCWSKLRTLLIMSCKSLKYVFPITLAQDLVHLEVLKIHHCDSLEHLIKEEESDYFLCWSKLRTLLIMSCESLKYVFPITLSQGLVHLEVLQIQHCDSLEHLIKEAESDYSLCWSKLRTLQIMSCKSLKYVFPITLARDLVHLEVLKIQHCDSLEHLIKDEESDYFLCWSKLRTLLIMSCESLKYVFPITLAQGLVHLEVLQIQHCDSLEHLIKEAESDYSLCWSKLRTLQIMSCKSLKYVFPITLARDLVHLEVLKIQHCDSLEHLIKEAESDYSLCWSKLRNLQIMSCKSLKYVFPITLAQGLVHLEVLKIWHCDSLEHLIKEAESDYSLYWSKLRTLQIMSCKNLKYEL